jgi:hypothetical protein
MTAITTPTATATITATKATAAGTCLGLSHVLEGQTAAQLVLAADELGWWKTLLDGGGRGAITPASGIQRCLARALVRIGWLAPAESDADQPPAACRLTDTGREIAFNRGFVRVVTRGWEPTFRAVAGPDTRGDFLPARTDPAAVARGCTDIARRHPETIAAIAARVHRDPGVTIDLGCADAGRLRAIAALAPYERLLGVDLEEGVVGQAAAGLAADALGDRIGLLSGDVAPGREPAPWLRAIRREEITTAMSFFLQHQLASDGAGVANVLGGWMRWFPNLRRLVIGDALLSEGATWGEQPWFAPTYELYHELTGVRLWWEREYLEAFTSLGWRVVERHDRDHEIVVTYVLER